MIRSVAAQGGRKRAVALPVIKPGTNTSFGQLRRINAGVLNVGYAEAGLPVGPPVILLHGWPYDIHTYVDVAPLLASVGYRAIVPYVAATASRAFSRPNPPGTGSSRRSPSTSSP